MEKSYFFLIGPITRKMLRTKKVNAKSKPKMGISGSPRELENCDFLAFLEHDVVAFYLSEHDFFKASPSFFTPIVL